MNIDLIDMLSKHRDDPGMGSIVSEALRFIEGSTLTSQSISTGLQSSMYVADLYQLRKRIGSVKESLCGLNESIASLGRQDVQVGFGMLKSDLGIVLIWYTDEEHYPAGIMVLKRRI
jgi:hypothetical protein